MGYKRGVQIWGSDRGSGSGSHFGGLIRCIIYIRARVKNKTGDLRPPKSPILPPNHGIPNMEGMWHNGDNYLIKDNNYAQCAYLPIISVNNPFYALIIPSIAPMSP